MKKLFLLMIIPLFFSCGKKKIAQLQELNDSLTVLSGQQDQVVIEYVKAFNDIQNNLDSIKAKENLITMATSGNKELGEDAKAKIEQDIQLIYQLMLDNKKKAEGLQAMLNKSRKQNTELKMLVERLNKDVADKDAEINNLKLQLASLNIVVENLTTTVDSLSKENVQKENVITTQTTSLNTAYYVINTEKKLKEDGVLTKEGGFIGLGKNTKLMQDFNQKFFTKIDISKTQKFSIKAKKPRFITTHPTGSFRFEYANDITESLIITDVNKFWSVSKYLVIVTE